VEKLMGPGVPIAANLILKAFWEADREAMIATISRALAGIKTEQILAP
jgi:hypothetical protein